MNLFSLFKKHNKRESKILQHDDFSIGYSYVYPNSFKGTFDMSECGLDGLVDIAKACKWVLDEYNSSELICKERPRKKPYIIHIQILLKDEKRRK